MQNGQAEKALLKATKSPFVEVLGLHCHIGSQIFDTTGFVLAAQKIMAHLIEWKVKHAFESKVLNLGGGFGIRYTSEDHPIQPAEYVEVIIKEVKEQVSNLEMTMPEI